MLAMKLIVFALVICTGVLCRDTRSGSARHRPAEDDYKYNHPPQPEFEAIPVAVVYENESNREDKSIKNNRTPENKDEQVKTDPPTSDYSVTKEPIVFEVTNKDNFDTTLSIEQENTKVTTYRPQREQQIPVAIVYEPEPKPNPKPRPNGNKPTNKRQKVPRPSQEESKVVAEDSVGSNVQINGHTGSIPTENKQRQLLNKRRKIQKPAPELKKTSVEESVISKVQESKDKLLIPTVDKTKEIDKTESIQPAPEEKQITVKDNITSNEQEKENVHSIPLVEKPKENIHRLKIPRPVSVREQINAEENKHPATSADKVEELNRRTAGSQQFSKRDNSTRVREVIPIVQSENVVFSHSGNFQYSYEGGDGTKAFEMGELKTFDDETAGEAVSGGFSYTGKDGNEYSLSYTADENGYRPVGAHLPTPPPIPPAIARALAYLATKPTPEPVTESIVENDE